MSLLDLGTKEIIKFVHNWRQDQSGGFDNSFLVERFDQGIGEAGAISDEISEKRTVRVTARNKLQQKQFVEDIRKLEGRRVSFWFIDECSPISLVSDVPNLAEVVTIRDDAYILDNRRIYIELQDGTEITRKIKSSTVGNTGTTDLEVEAMVEVNTGEIVCANILRLMRSNTDIPNLNFFNLNVFECDIELVEAVNQYESV